MSDTLTTKALKTGSLVHVGPRTTHYGLSLVVEARSYLEAMLVDAAEFGEEWRTARTYNGTRYLVKLSSDQPVYHRLWTTMVYRVELYGVESGAGQLPDGRWAVTLEKGRFFGPAWTRVDAQS